MKALLTYLFILVSVSIIAQSDTTSILERIERASSMDQESAIEELEKLSNLSDRDEFLSGSIQSRKKLATLYLLTNKQYEGLRAYFQLIHLLEKNNKYQLLSETYKNLSEHYSIYGLYLSSAQYLEKRIALTDSHEVDIDLYYAYMDLGDLYFKAFEYQTAQENYRLAQEQAESNGRSRRGIKARRRIVKTQEKQFDYQACLESNLEILQKLEESNNDMEISAQMNNIGFNYKKLDHKEEALSYFQQTLKIREELKLSDSSHIPLLINIAITLQNLERQSEALTYLNRALKASSAGDAKTRVKIHNLISIAKLTQGSAYDALIENDKALSIAEKQNIKEEQRDLYYTRSAIHEALLEYDQALSDYKMYLEINDSITLHQKLNEQNILQQQIIIEKTEKEIQNLIAANDIKDYQLEQLKLESTNKDIELRNQELQAKEKLQDLKIRQQDLENQNKEKELQAAKAREENQRLILKQNELEEEKQKQAITLLETKTKVQDLEIQKSKAANRSLFIISLLSLLVMIIAVIAFFGIRKSNKAVKFEKARSEKLLLNILPEATAEELKTLGKSMPRNYDSVTILFTDFKGFTTLTENLHPEELVESLDAFFAGFDEIMTEFGIEKIKTIGDAYMCACGVPEPVADHGIRMVRAAQKMLQHSNNINRLKREKGLPVWDLRIGINSGSVVAGVIGTNKFQYDIWGDSVNLAARMESSGHPNRINISESTHQEVENQIPCTYRGEIEAKNKGKVKMYFVD